ncbi:hypothetical protein LTR95_007468 [Oleoguttula sp. CCFEE 5521]
MATAAFGRDLPEAERLAYEEGHDADLIPSQDLRHKDHDDPEKHGLSHTSSETLSYRGHDADVEKAGPDVPITEKSGTETAAIERDPNIVDWEGDDDPECPLNWTPARKWGNIAVLSAITLLTPLASSMFAPGVPRVMEDFKTDNQALATFVVSVYILGYAIGPLVLAPMSELYGRLWVYHVCNWAYVAFTVACALATSMNMLIGFRFMAGVFGVAPLTIGGGTIADLMRPAERGSAMAVWALGPLLGPVIGPIAGGFLSDAEGWRWIFWVLAIAIGIMAIIGLFTMQETYGPTLLARKTKKLQKQTGNMALRSKLDLGLTPRQVFLRSIVRPLKLMFLSPICALMSLYMAVVYGILYLLFTTFTFVFEQNYGFSKSTVGLVYIGMGIGMLGGLGLLGATSDRIMKRLAAKHSNSVLKPEYRLPPLMYGAPFIPAGLFIYGWTAQYNVQWAAPIFGTLLVGVGLIAAFMAVNTYLVDAFTLYAASAMAAATVLRSVFGACFPLFGLQMYGALGLGWGNSLLGFLSLALCPIPWAFYYYGERMRNSKRFKVEF